LWLRHRLLSPPRARSTCRQSLSRWKLPPFIEILHLSWSSYIISFLWWIILIWCMEIAGGGCYSGWDV
jgi:hypothetical protein